MDRLWHWQRQAAVREFRGRPDRTGPLACTTVNTVADILAGEGLLEPINDNRAWLCRALVSREQYTVTSMHDALGASPDRTAALAPFLQQRGAEDAADIGALLREGDTTDSRERPNPLLTAASARGIAVAFTGHPLAHAASRQAEILHGADERSGLLRVSLVLPPL